MESAAFLGALVAYLIGFAVAGLVSAATYLIDKIKHRRN